MAHYVMEVTCSLGGLLFEFFSKASEGKMCVKLGIIALLFSHVNKETEECSSEIQLVSE